MLPELDVFAATAPSAFANRVTSASPTMTYLPLEPLATTKRRSHAFPRDAGVDAGATVRPSTSAGTVERQPPMKSAGSRGAATSWPPPVEEQRNCQTTDIWPEPVVRPTTSSCTSATSVRKQTSGASQWVARSGFESAPTVLEEENRLLKEELARYRKDAMEFISAQRRPMAAIVGGGFRNSQAHKQCMCESLRAKLTKAKIDLRELQRLSAPWRENSAVAASNTTSQSHAEVQACSLYRVQSTQTMETGMASPRCTNVEAPEMCDAAVQALVFPISVSHASTQASMKPDVREVDVQAGCVPLTEASVQTGGIEVSHALVQCEAATTCVAEIGTQVECSAVSWGEAAAQTELCCTEARATQACALTWDCEVQTDALPLLPKPKELVHMSCQASEEPPRAQTSERGMQTLKIACPANPTAAVQTLSVALANKATETVLQPRVDFGCQMEDEVQAARVKAQDAQVIAQTSKLLELEATVKSLAGMKTDLQDVLRLCREDSEAWQQMAQSKAMGHMNITILCPRAECTIGGEKIEMDSWNPSKLKEEFENEVLPRFARVFVSNEEGSQPRPEAVERTMQEFVDAFRSRLSAMLEAPNASAAVMAASRGVSKRTSCSQ